MKSRIHFLLHEYAFIFWLSVYAILLLIFRFVSTHQLRYAFLVWNLFLAAIPLVISTLLLRWEKRKEKPNILKLIPLGLLWLLFLPNAPYIITDLFHLRLKGGAPIWFDLILILSFGLLGILLGMKSLEQVNRLLWAYVNKNIAHVFNVFVLFLCAFGIYIGRFQRWNSWDAFTNPIQLLYDTYALFEPTIFSSDITQMTFVYGVFLLLCYYGYHINIRRMQKRFS